VFLPISDAPNPRGTPFVTWGLIAVNVVVFVLVAMPLANTAPSRDDPRLAEYLRAVQEAVDAPRSVLARVSSYDLFVFEHGYRPVEPSLSDLLVSMFLHGGLMHLFGNMLFLWIYGDNVENRLGPFAFLVAYLGTGAAATLTHAAFDSASPLPMVGASGAISGVLGFYFLWFPRNRVNVFVFLFPFIMDVITVPARFVLGVYVLLDNLLPFLARGVGSGGVAYGAHLGGFVAGLGAAWMLGRREEGRGPRAFAATGSDGDVDALRAALAEGRFAEAASRYFALDEATARAAVPPGPLLGLGDWLLGNRHAEAALLVFRRVLRGVGRGPDRARALLGAGLVRWRLQGQLAPAYQHLLDALDADPPPDVEAAARATLDEIARAQSRRGRLGGRA